MLQIFMYILNACLCSSILEAKTASFKEKRLTPKQTLFLHCLTRSTTFQPTTGRDVYFCDTAKFSHIRQVYPFFTEKTRVLPVQVKKSFQDSVSGFTGASV